MTPREALIDAMTHPMGAAYAIIDATGQPNAVQAIQKLRYEKSKLPNMDNVQISPSPDDPEGEVWIVRTAPQTAAQAAPPLTARPGISLSDLLKD